MSHIGDELDKKHLYQAIMDPSADIHPGYISYLFQLDDGSTTPGFLIAETPEKIVIKTKGGIVQEMMPDQVEDRVKQPVSAMPAGLSQVFTVNEMVDLVEYLATLRPASP